MAAERLEAEIQREGRELLAGVRPERLIALTPAWWQERIMAWATGDPAFRVKLLRFVDVLPALRTPAAVADHVRQYFRGDAPLPVRVGSSVAAAGAFRPVLSRVVRQGVFAMADRFIGGATPAETLPRLRELVAGGTAYTIDLLGEATLAEDEADAYRERYLELIATLARESAHWRGDARIRQPNVSIKLSALTSHFESAAPLETCRAVRTRLDPVLALARREGVFVNVDMEQYRYKDLVHVIVEETLSDGAFRDWADAGVVVQAYLRDALDDIARLKALAERRGTPITIRLVKGAYWDEEVVVAAQEGHPLPVFREKAATDANYEACTEALAAAYPHLRPAFGTHNPRSIAQAIVRTRAAGIPGEDVEFQMLFGMAEGLRRAVRQRGYRTRVYVPAGEVIPGMAYLVRRLLENTSNESWFLHRHEEGDPDILLAPPAVNGEAHDAETPSPGFANEAPLEFHRPEVRERFRSAVTAAGSVVREVPLLIGERAEYAREQDEVRPPAHPSRLLGRVARATRADADAAVSAARQAFPAWRDRGWHERAECLRGAAAIVAARRYDLAALMVHESAKPWREADGDVTELIDYLRYYAAQGDRLADGAPLLSPRGEDNRLFYEGRGVAAVIAPWNFPFAIVGGMTSAALVAGCTVVVKPAEQSPLIAAELVHILREAGVPAGAVHYLPGPGEEVGEALVTHAGVDVVAFTGSRAVGLHILEAAAKVQPGQRNIKRVICEMGGKNAIIVDDDADLDAAVSGVVASAFGFAGQKCSAASRVIVVGSAYEAFRERLGGAVRSLVVGPPEDPYTAVPPVISAEAKAGIERYVALGRASGRLVAEAQVPAGEGWYVAPVVFEGVAADSPLSCEEVFGPVLALYRAESFREAVAMALDSPYALTGGIFSRNPRNIALARRDFRVGNLYINRKITGAIVGRQPFGGFAMSGAGDKAGGPDYVQQFTFARTVTENTVRRGFAAEASLEDGLLTGGA